MKQIANVEGDEIVIRIPISALEHDPGSRDFIVRDAVAFAPHVAREMSDEDVGEQLYIDNFVQSAIDRAAESDAPGIDWQEQ